MEELFKRVMEAQREAFKNQIAANTVLINERIAKVKPFIFGNSLIPAMICGLEVKVTNELPDNISFVVVKATQTEREKLVAQTREETAKEILRDIHQKLAIDYVDEEIGYQDECIDTACLYEDLRDIAQKYGVEIDK